MPTKQRTRTDFLALTISAGEGESGNWQTDPGEHPLFRNRYRVTVQSDATDRTIRFDYFDSAHRHDEGIDQLDREHLLYAFWSFCNDAQAGENTFKDFCQEYGYDEDSRAVKRTYDACRTALRKFSTLWHDKREPSAILELLAAEGIE